LTAPTAPLTAINAAATWVTLTTASTTTFGSGNAAYDVTGTANWGTVANAVPGQVIGFQLPDKCRIDDIYTTVATDWVESVTNAERALTERGSYQGSISTNIANRGRVSFMVPTDATTGATYYAGLKINNDGVVQYLSVSATTGFSETNIYNNGLTSLTGDKQSTVALGTI
jgi:hypothetical protein